MRLASNKSRSQRLKIFRGTRIFKKMENKSSHSLAKAWQWCRKKVVEKNGNGAAICTCGRIESVVTGGAGSQRRRPGRSGRPLVRPPPRPEMVASHGTRLASSEWLALVDAGQPACAYLRGSSRPVTQRCRSVARRPVRCGPSVS